jgi:cytochrome c biogenesis protein CcmG, thiol:disulfide interchange protein DsbE
MRFLLAFLLSCSAGLAQAQQGAQLRPWTGGPTPSLALQTLGGKTVRIEDYRGKVVLINFWATWCEPCRDEMPSMNKLRAAFAGRPFEVLAVNLGEGESRIKRFLEQVPLDFPVLMDRDSAVAKGWKVRVLPASFLVGPDGHIRYSTIGEYDWSQEAARSAIGALLVPETIQPRAALSASSR